MTNFMETFWEFDRRLVFETMIMLLYINIKFHVASNYRWIMKKVTKWKLKIWHGIRTS
jgi:hypothetical protein